MKIPTPVFPKADKFSTDHSTRKAVRHLPVFLVLCFVIFPLLLAAFYMSFQTFRELHDFTLSRREATASLAATTLKEKFDRVIDVGISLATRVQFQKLVESGKWDEAIKIMEAVPENFPYIDTIALFDPKGVLGAVTPLTPEILPFIGQDFSYRDYYQGVSKSWQPYVSEVFKRAPKPQYNVVSIAVPIKSADRVLGVLLLTIKLDTIIAWSKDKKIDVGRAGFIYIVDQKGHLAGHPDLSSEGDVIDYSSVPSVQKVLEGERGVEVLFNPIENEERVTAYEPVPGYGWGVIVVQPTRTAFVERNGTVRRVAAIWAFVVLAVGFFTYRLLRDRTIMEAQRDRERMLLEGIGDGVIAIDRAFNIISWNKAATALTGRGREEALGRPMREVVKFIRERDRKEDIVFIEEAMLYGEQKTMEENTLLVQKDGMEIPIGDSAAPVFDSSGRVAGAIIVFRDISKERQAAKIREEVLFQTIHDLRAPATAIKLAAENFSDSEYLLKHPEMLNEGVSLIEEANTRILGLINSLLESARNKAGIVKHDPVMLPNIISGVIKEFAPAAGRKGIKIEYLPSQALPQVFANTERLKEIFSNLIDNAIKYNKDGSTVTIKHEEEDNIIKTTIQDTGIGISAENLPKLFTPYFRENAERQVPGTGLGLFIVKKFVEEAGGRITADSIIGQGTTFSIYLPVAEK